MPASRDVSIRDQLLPGLRKNISDVCSDNKCAFLDCNLFVEDGAVSVGINGSPPVPLLASDEIDDRSYIQKWRPRVQAALIDFIKNPPQRAA